MADRHPGGWQFRSVTEIGASLDSIERLGEETGLWAKRQNLPPGTAVSRESDFIDPNPQPADLTVVGPYIRLEWAIPSDLAGEFTWDGRVRILRKSRSFPRDLADAGATQVFDHDFSAELYYGSIPRDSYSPLFTELDQDIGVPGDVWYYTIFFGNAETTNFAFSPEHSLARNWALRNEDTSRWGDHMYSQLPRTWRVHDTENELAVQRLLQAVGRIFDGIEEETLQIKDKVYDVDNVDASLLPYIDQMLGWPTNFELDEETRRLETGNAVAVWKSKGTAATLEFVLQLITGWDVTIYEGWRWVFRTDPEGYDLDPGSPPAGWNEPTDGVWADLVNDLVISRLYDNTDPTHLIGTGTPQDGKTYLWSNEVVSEGGLGWPWQNPNGLLIELSPVAGSNIALGDTAARKVIRLAPLLLPHYATFAVAISFSSEEVYPWDGADSYLDDIEYLVSESFALDMNEQDSAESPQSLMYSFPESAAPLNAVSGNVQFRSYSREVSLVGENYTDSIGNLVLAPIPLILRHHVGRL